MFKRPVISTFRVCRKVTGRQFSAVQMILQAIATGAFPRTRLIAAIAFLLVSLLFAFHDDAPSLPEPKNPESKISN
jgi:hypothetical protein